MDDIFLGLAANGEKQNLLLGRANRHGLIAGATGTGKTVTLQTIAEQFSGAGVPVFLADVKGDLSGITMAGSHEFKHADKIAEYRDSLIFGELEVQALLDAEPGQRHVMLRCDSVPRQAVLHAMQRAAVERDHGATRLGQLHQ